MANQEIQLVTLGLERSGTNFLSELIKNNVEENIIIVDQYHAGGIWKHDYNIDEFLIESCLKSIRMLWICKNPYSWIDSIIRAEKKYKWPIVLQKHDKIHNYEHEIEFLINVYQNYMNFWLPLLIKYNIPKFTYEFLISGNGSYDNILDAVCVKYGLNKKNTVSIPKTVAKSNSFDIKKDLIKYHNCDLEYLNDKDIEKINGLIPEDLLSKLGYEKRKI